MSKRTRIYTMTGANNHIQLPRIWLMNFTLIIEIYNIIKMILYLFPKDPLVPAGEASFLQNSAAGYTSPADPEAQHIEDIGVSP